jgi:uncharacterized membrane protein YqjE
MSESGTPAGLFGSLRQFAATLVEIAQVRLQLFGNELEQEKLRLIGALLLAVTGLMLLTVGTLLLCAFLVMLVAEGHRLTALGVMTLATVGGAVLLLRACVSRLRSPPGGAFAGTLAELSRDRSALTAGEQSHGQ